MKLPEKFVQEHLNNGMVTTMCGIDIRELSRDELLATCIFAIEQYHQTLKQGARDVRLMKDLCDARYGV